MADVDFAPKRRRLERESERRRSPSPIYKLDDAADDYVPYVPVAKRREAKLAALASRGIGGDKDKRTGSAAPDANEEEEDEEVQARDRERKERTLLLEAQEVHKKKAAEGNYSCDVVSVIEAR